MNDNFVRVPWAILDSDLDPYQRQLWIHIARVGICWQSIRTMADACKMSKSKVAEVKVFLLENGYLEHAVDEKSGRAGVIAIVPECPSHGQTQQNERPPRGQRPPHGQVVHHTDAERPPHGRHLKKNTKEEHIEENDDDDARAEAATLEILDYWQDLTGSFAPGDPHKRAMDYLGPLNRLWIRVDRDVGEAKRQLREKRDEMLEQGKTPYRPAAIVPAIFAELDGVQPRASPNGHNHSQPESDPDNWKPISEGSARL